MTRSGSSAPSAAISADAAGSAPNGDEDARPRRDFLHLAAGTAVAVGTAASLWPFIDSMNPSRDLLALKTVELDLDAIEPGQRVMLEWRRQPLFVNHRTPEEIARAKADDAAELIDPEPDGARVQRDEWLVVVGVCTHLGCVPLGQRAGARRGPWAGWFCPCHGSAYDTSGRVRRGPAPKNLRVPPYRFLDDGVLMVG